LWGAVSAGVAYGVGSAFSGSAVAKSLAHGLTRAAISKGQGGRYSEGFWSGFASSALGGTIGKFKSFGGQMSMAAIVGGTASKLGGGKFANGAVSGAFVHMYNESAHFDVEAHNAKVLANEKAFNTAYGKNGDAYMMGDTKVGQSVISVSVKALAIGVTISRAVATLGYKGVTYIAAFFAGTVTGAGGATAMEVGFGKTNVQKVVIDKVNN